MLLYHHLSSSFASMLFPPFFVPSRSQEKKKIPTKHYCGFLLWVFPLEQSVLGTEPHTYDEWQRLCRVSQAFPSPIA